MDFRHLELFMAVVEAGSVSRAAKNLEMTQPPVSAAISKLERELNVRLLERTAKGVHPTNAGMFLLTQAGRLVAERDRLTETLTLMGEGVVGELRIGVEPMVINEVIADVASEFLDQTPGARLSLTDVPPDVILSKLRTGELDMGCIPFSPDQCADFVREEFDLLPIAEIDVRLAVPRHRMHEYHPDGSGWGRWILPYRLPAFTGFPDYARHALAGDDTFEVLEVSTPQTAVSFVAAGLGVAPVTRRLAENNVALALLSPPRFIAPMRASLLWRRDDELTPLMERWTEATRMVARALE
jgi:LysR family transcriptional regulator, benzoate and cis,cis-muconate-responsive activator of ben and cat genes